MVGVSADINYDTITRTEEKFDPDGQVIRSQTKNDEDNDATTGTPSLGAGISANTSTESNSAPAASSALNNTKNKRLLTTVQYEVSRSTSNLMQGAGGIKRLSASVTVATRFEGTGPERKLVARPPEELEKLRRIVASAVGVQTGTDNTRGDLITLEELPFNDQFATDVTHGFDQQQKQQFWWDLARTAGYPALGLCALLLLLRIFKHTPVQEMPLGIPVGRLIAGQKSTNGNGADHLKWGANPPPDVVTVEVLNRLIKENPANMTQAIRDWLDKGRASSS